MMRTEQEAESFAKIVKAYRAFYRGAHAMNAAAELERQAAKADAIALLTLLQDTTQSRSVAERCAKAKAVLS